MPTTDTYERTYGITEAVAVTPSDTADVPLTVARGLYVGVAGDVSVILAENTAPVTIPGLAAGIWHPMAVRRVRSTGTTATGIVVGR
jgi:hypothetical protein